MADDLKVRRAKAGADKMRSFATFAYAARSWSRKRRVVARLEASTRGFDARYIVTSLAGEPRHLYEDIYCARGQAENLIKMHKGQLASDRTSCQSPIANQLRLILHTAAYWLMLALRDAIPRTAPLARAEFATLRLRLLKIQAAPPQDRRPRRREGHPHPHPLHIGLPGRRPLPPAGRPSRRSRPLSAGAPCPDHPGSFNLQPNNHHPQIPAPNRVRPQRDPSTDLTGSLKVLRHERVTVTDGRRYRLRSSFIRSQVMRRRRLRRASYFRQMRATW